MEARAQSCLIDRARSRSSDAESGTVYVGRDASATKRYIERTVRGGRRDAERELARVVAHDLGLAPNTVARTYRALEDAGLVETRGRRGTPVSHVEPISPIRRSQVLGEAAAPCHNEAVRLGASLDDALEALRLHALERGTWLAAGNSG